MSYDSMIALREVQASDLEQLVALFKETVHSVNAKDYTREQLLVWAPPDTNPSGARWQSLLHNIAYIAELNGVLVGFADLTKEGYLDRLFVHKDYQRQSIASILVKLLEAIALTRHIKKITTEASITAKPFFEHKGYKVIKEQSKVVSGIKLTNFIMEKQLSG